MGNFISSLLATFIVEFIGAVGIAADDRNLTTLTVIPYILKVEHTN